MAFPKYYIFDASLAGSVQVVFDDHPMHADNLREHLEGFVALPDPTFDIQGVWRRPDVLLYANGLVNRMRDGLVWLLPKETRKEFAAWLSKVEWPTEETMGKGFLLPGRWLEAEEAARFWLSLQGVSPTVSKAEMRAELKRLGVRIERFSEHRKQSET